MLSGSVDQKVFTNLKIFFLVWSFHSSKLFQDEVVIPFFKCLAGAVYVFILNFERRISSETTESFYGVYVLLRARF